MATGMILVYDGECRACRSLARWVEQRTDRIEALPYQAPGLLDQLGLSPEQAEHEVWLIEPGRWRRGGPAAIRRLFEELGGAWRWISRLLNQPALRPLEARFYRWFSANRHRF